MSSPVLLLAWMIVSMYLSLIAHELGHAVLGARHGYTIEAVGIGFGRPLLVIRALGTRIYLGRRRLGIGLTLAMHPQMYATRDEQIGLMRGGMAANTLLAVLSAAVVVLFPVVRMPALMFTLVNLLMLASSRGTKGPSALPVRTDGAQILAVQRDVPIRFGSGSETPDPGMIELLAGLRSPLLVYQYRMGIAWSLLECGQIERAKSEHELARSELPSDGVDIRAFTGMVDGSFDMATGGGDAALSRFLAAEAEFEAGGNARGVFMARLSRARILLQPNRAVEAAALVDVLDEDVHKRQLAGASRAVAQLQLQAAMALDRPDVKTRIDQCEQDNRVSPDAELSLLLARACIAVGDPARAVGFAETALDLRTQMFLSRPDGDAKAVYLQAKRAELEGLSELFRTAGQPEKLADIDAHFSAADVDRQEADQRSKAASKRVERRGNAAYAAAATLLTISFAVGCLAAARMPNPDLHWDLHIAFIGVAFMSVLMAVCNVLLYPLWRRVVPGHSVGGWFALGTAIVPWLCLLPR